MCPQETYKNANPSIDCNSKKSGKLKYLSTEEWIECGIFIGWTLCYLKTK